MGLIPRNDASPHRVGLSADAEKLNLERELRALRTLAPDSLDDLRSAFQEAVTDSIANLLEESAARALLRIMGDSDFQSPDEVFGALDTILGDGSLVIEGAIAEEFSGSAHLLLEKAKRHLAAELQLARDRMMRDTREADAPFALTGTFQVGSPRRD